MANPGRRKKKKKARCSKCNDACDNLTYFRHSLLCPDCLNGDSIITSAKELNELPFVSSALGWSV